MCAGTIYNPTNKNMGGGTQWSERAETIVGQGAITPGTTKTGALTSG